MARFRDATSTFSESRTRRAVRTPAIKSDVLVPFLQAAISGAVCTVLTVAAMQHWPGVPSYAPILVFGGVTAFGWFVLLAITHRQIWEEEITRTPVVQAGNGAKSEAVNWNVTGEFTDPTTGKVHRDEFPGDPRRLREFAQALLDNRVGFTFRGARVCRYTDSDFTELRLKFLNHQWATEKGSGVKDGVELTEAGWQVVRNVAATPLPKPK